MKHAILNLFTPNVWNSNNMELFFLFLIYNWIIFKSMKIPKG